MVKAQSGQLMDIRISELHLTTNNFLTYTNLRMDVGWCIIVDIFKKYFQACFRIPFIQGKIDGMVILDSFQKIMSFNIDLKKWTGERGEIRQFTFYFPKKNKM